MVWLARMYARRIVNVNVNVILAGVLAMALTLIPVHFSREFTDDKRVILLVTFAADVIFDVLIYYALHWLANHVPKLRKKQGVGVVDLSFIKDATLVQFERALLAPIYYGIAMGLQYYLLHQHWHRETATATALFAGILTTRTLHTIWMLYQARRAERLGKIPPAPLDTVAQPPAPVPPPGHNPPEPVARQVAEEPAVTRTGV